MQKLCAALFLSLWLASAALAQQVTNPSPNAGIYGAYNVGSQTCVTGTGCWVQTDINGNLKVAVVSGGGAATSFGAAFPATGTAVGFTDGTNMVAGRVRNPGSGASIGDAAVVVVDPNVQAAVAAATIALGQTTKSASVPVTIASDQYIDPCQSPNIAKSSVPINLTSAAGTTSLVAVSGSTVVYVCGVSFTIAPSATTADSILFEYGTGAACTSPTALTGTFGSGDLTTSAPPVTVNYGGAGSTIFKSAASNGVCALTAGGTINIQGVMTYVQQ